MAKLVRLTDQLYRLQDGLAAPTPAYGNNKVAKLIGHLWAARQAGATTLIALGGAYSNLLQAVADIGPEGGFQTIALVRGEEVAIRENPRIIALEASGMTVIQLDRSTYRQVCIDGLPALEAYSVQHPALQCGTPYLLPEGASGSLALPGLVEAATSMINQLMTNHAELFVTDWPTLVVPCGTASTLFGIGLAYQHWAQLHHKSAMTIGYLPFREQAYADQLMQTLAMQTVADLELLNAIYPSPVWEGLRLPDAFRHLSKAITLKATTGLGRYGQPSEAVVRLSQSASPPMNPIYSGYAYAAHQQSGMTGPAILIDTGGN